MMLAQKDYDRRLRMAAEKEISAIKAFLDREYAPDGRGGLFYIPGIDIDMRQVEIWRQMMMWNNKQRRF